ncbi:MAG TPA: histidine kinase [Chitinophagaceae bacterium]|nr:histidine kinase [Chitinophagaceae bacterium]
MKPAIIQRILLHAAFWIFYLLVSNAYYAVPGKYTAELWYTAAMLPFYMLFTYPQVYLFIPKLLLKKKIALYVLVSLVFAKIVWWLNFSTYNHFLVPLKFGGKAEPFFYSMPWEIHLQGLKSAFPMVMICGVAVSIKLIKKWYLQNELNQKIQNEKLAMELEMLKAQVHPHFLFNTLNNLYSLTLTHSEAAPVVVTHLSGLLRYMLYECNQQEVPLNNEMAALKKYVELEKLRYGNRLDISFSCTGQLNGLMIAPLLLLPFVENSFKHGVSEQLDQCWVNIHLHAEADELTFNLSNSYSKDKTAGATGGIGLQNIRKRLQLIYKDGYQLSVSEQEDTYAVKLNIQLKRVLQVASFTETTFTEHIPLPAL